MAFTKSYLRRKSQSDSMIAEKRFRKPVAARRRLQMESLEDRNLLASLTVNSLADDTTSGDGLVTLREAIIAANTDATTDLSQTGSGADTITFAPSLNGGLIELGLGTLQINESITIRGPGADQLAIGYTQVSVAQGLSTRIFGLGGAGAQVYRIEGLTLTGGVSDFGAAIRISDGDDRLEVIRSEIRDNFSESGAIAVAFGSLLIRDSTISGNEGAFGGGLNLQNASTRIEQSTISGNTATVRGAGILNFAAGAAASSSLTILNSTITGNSAPTGANLAQTTQGGGLAATTQIGNTIFSNPLGGGRNFLNRTAESTVTSLGNNLWDDTSGPTAATGDQPNTDPMIGPLADNGGPTRTHTLLSGSLAIDAGNNALAVDGDGNPLTTDQRGEGFTRIFGSTIDVGALETLVVNTLTDELDFTNNAMSLREAIDLASGSGAGTITFSPSLNGGLIELSLGTLQISKSITIRGPGADQLAIGYTQASQALGLSTRIFNLGGAGAQVYRIEGLTLTGGNSGSGAGSAIELNDGNDRLEVIRSELRDGFGDGAIRVNEGSLLIRDSTIADNTGAFGAGVSLVNASARIEQTTISGNRATVIGGGISNFAGGAGASSSLTILNSTITGNSAPTGANLDQTTQDGGLAATIQIGNTIVSNSLGGGRNFFNQTAESTVTSLGNNLWDDTSGPTAATDDQPNTDPMIGPLADNGGPTRTHTLLSGSLAIDAGNNGLAVDGDGNPLTTDQRGEGFPRILGSTVDVGALEPLPAGKNLVVRVADNDTDIVLVDGTTEVVRFTAPLTNLTVTGGPLDDVITVENLSSLIPGVIPIQIDAGTGNDTLRLAGSGQMLDLTHNSLNGIETIDIRGSGINQLTAGSAITGIPDSGTTLRLLADPTDKLEWGEIVPEVSGTRTQDGAFVVEVTFNDSQVIEVVGMGWTNPILQADVDGVRGVEALDALLIVNQLGRGISDLVLENTNTLIPPSELTIPFPNFFDVSADGELTALDALQVINTVERNRNSTPETESPEPELLLSLGNLPANQAEAFDVSINTSSAIEDSADDTDRMTIGEPAKRADAPVTIESTDRGSSSEPWFDAANDWIGGSRMESLLDTDLATTRLA